VGSKILVADTLEKWDTIGIDCIAMNVNDTICVGATPISFVDYIACNSPQKEVLRAIGKGLNRGAKEAGVEIVGGEVALLPEMINGVDLVGACLGYVDKKRIITGERIRPGDLLIGVSSSGIHSNGLTLARRVVAEHGVKLTDEVVFGGERFVIGEELLIPTAIYVKDILSVCRRFDVKGIAHITGGGLRKLNRIKHDVMFKITHLPEPPRIFRLIAEWGNIHIREMYQTFNMGIGMILAVSREECEDVIQHIEKRRQAWMIGEVMKGSGVEIPGYRIRYPRY
jgi:phosphoribosylformylglycinamidine cyclo-ligase